MTLKENFIMFAKRRSEDSKGTPYEWDFDKLYPTEQDIEFFISVIEEHPIFKWDIHIAFWHEIMDWFEDLPIY
jgi:hypothetical protein